MSASYVVRYGVLEVLTSITELELEVLRLLKDGEKTPREISKILDKSDSQVLHVLRSLKDKGIVTSEKGEGRSVYYRIKEELSWIKDMIECVDMLSELDNKFVMSILSNSRLTAWQKEQAIKYYYKKRDEQLKKWFEETVQKVLEDAKRMR